VRLIATTNRDLKAEVDAGKFRGDLYYRLNVMPIQTPALRERADDIPRLVHHFLQRFADHLGVSVPAVAPETVELLQRYAWPGNVRELANAIERALILSREPVLQPSAFPEQSRQVPAAAPDGAGTAAMPAVPAVPASGADGVVVPAAVSGVGPAAAAASRAEAGFDLEEIERRAIARALEATGGNRTRAAKLLGISERTLRNKLNTPKLPISADAE